jgi:uncharacterized protein
MKWLNEPKKWSYDDSVLKVAVDGETDFWRITHYDFIRNNGHFYYQEQSGDFTAKVGIMGRYRELYDQHGLMIRRIRCGVWRIFHQKSQCKAG